MGGPEERGKETKGPPLLVFAPGFKRYDGNGLSNRNACGTAAVSVTGTWCALRCDHCAAVILHHTPAALTPDDLLKRAESLARRGGRSILITGGSRKDGSVPLERFAGVLARIREETGMRVLVHTGLVNESLADALAEARIYLAMMDVVGDRETIRGVLHLDAGPGDYERALDLLAERGVPVAPHVVLGLGYGRPAGEKAAFAVIEGRPVRSVVLVLFRPVPGTPMARCRPLSPEQAGGLFREARRRFPGIPLVLGCERPLGRHRRDTDRLALEAGLDGIAFPADATLDLVRREGRPVRFRTECCALAGEPWEPEG